MSLQHRYRVSPYPVITSYSSFPSFMVWTTLPELNHIHCGNFGKKHPELPLKQGALPGLGRCGIPTDSLPAAVRVGRLLRCWMETASPPSPADIKQKDGGIGWCSCLLWALPAAASRCSLLPVAPQPAAAQSCLVCCLSCPSLEAILVLRH